MDDGRLQLFVFGVGYDGGSIEFREDRKAVRQALYVGMEACWRHILVRLNKNESYTTHDDTFSATP